MKANSQKKQTTVSEEKPELASVSPRWRALKEEKGLRGDTDVAFFLLDLL